MSKPFRIFLAVINAVIQIVLWFPLWGLGLRFITNLVGLLAYENFVAFLILGVTVGIALAAAIAGIWAGWSFAKTGQRPKIWEWAVIILPYLLFTICGLSGLFG